MVCVHVSALSKVAWLKIGMQKAAYRGGGEIGAKNQVDRTHYIMTLPNSTVPVK